MRLEEGRAGLAEVGVDPRAPRRAALEAHRGEVGIGEIVEPRLERGIFGDRGAELLAVAKLDRAPAAARENLVEALEHAVGRGRVEALAIIVDDPPAIADVVLVALDQRFVDIALVELGIADQRDEAPAIRLGHLAVRGEIILHQAGEGGDRDAEPDRPGREIDRDLVLGPAGIALHAAEAAEILQLLDALRAEQIMDRVEQRPAVRLDRDAVVGAERVEIERGHQRRHRRAARLVPADLQPVAAVADMVGVVDRPRRQEAQPLVEDVERRRGRGQAASAWRCP